MTTAAAALWTYYEIHYVGDWKRWKYRNILHCHILHTRQSRSLQNYPFGIWMNYLSAYIQYHCSIVPLRPTRPSITLSSLQFFSNRSLSQPVLIVGTVVLSDLITDSLSSVLDIYVSRVVGAVDVYSLFARCAPYYFVAPVLGVPGRRDEVIPLSVLLAVAKGPIPFGSNINSPLSSRLSPGMHKHHTITVILL